VPSEFYERLKLLDFIDGYRADVYTFLEDDDRVAAFGVYFGTYIATGR
jgi:hypothetical protein